MAVETTTEHARDCHRLVATIRARGDAQHLTVIELLHLADWLSQPPSDDAAWEWCESVALPVVRELGRRLQQHRDTQAISLPAVLAQVHTLRAAQHALHFAKRQPREVKLRLSSELAHAEAAIDALIDQHYHPTLF